MNIKRSQLVTKGYLPNSNSVAQKTLTVNSYHDLPKCNSDFKLIRAVVTSENKTYICSENEWQDDFL